jgi:gluconate 2-dehydrogenase gamma chain
MNRMTRREMLGLVAMSALAAACDRGPAGGAAGTGAAGASTVGQPGFPGAPLQFFTEHEMETVRTLVDIVIPKDDRSGSATEAGVPEFMDFMMHERESARPGMRGGLAWLDRETRDRFGKTFVACSAAERTAVLDDIAWPDRARPEMEHGTRFFTSFRDLTAAGFWSSKMGVEDLQYMGNRPQASWDGCPEPALVKLGVRYPTTSA